MFGAAGLQQQFIVRLCEGDTDMQGIEQLVISLSLGGVVLDDVRQYMTAYRDVVSVEILHSILWCYIVIVSSVLLKRLSVL